ALMCEHDHRLSLAPAPGPEGSPPARVGPTSSGPKPSSRPSPGWRRRDAGPPLAHDGVAMLRETPPTPFGPPRGGSPAPSARATLVAWARGPQWESARIESSRLRHQTRCDAALERNAGSNASGLGAQASRGVCTHEWLRVDSSRAMGQGPPDASR